MIIALPPDALVLLVGPSGAGKSTFAARHFVPTEVLSSDAMRAMVADDPMDQAATDAAFELLHTAVAMRLSLRRLAVVDATNVEGWAREKLLSIGAACAAAGPRHRLRPAARGVPAPQPGARQPAAGGRHPPPASVDDPIPARRWPTRAWTPSGDVVRGGGRAAQISRVAPALSS